MTRELQCEVVGRQPRDRTLFHLQSWSRAKRTGQCWRARKIKRTTALIMLVALAVGVTVVVQLLLPSDPDGRLLLWRLILPPMPFLTLALLVWRGALGAPLVSSTALGGAVVGALIMLLVPAGYAWYNWAVAPPPDANIGLGLIFLAQPVFVPLATWLGWQVGTRLTTPR